MDLSLDRDVTVGKHTLGRLNVGVMEGLKEWAAPMVESEIALTRELLPHLPPEAAAKKVEEVIELRKQLDCFSFESPLAKALLGTSAGQIKLIHLRLLARNDKATEDDAYEVFCLIGNIEAEKAKKRPRPNAETPAA